jgi:hypothetical protein
MRTALDHAGAPGIPIFNKGGPFSFPARYTADATMPLNEKDAVVRKMGHQPHVNLTLTEEDMEVIRDKEKMVQQAQFDAWVSARFKPHVDPAASEWLQKVYPEWFEMRAKENAEHHMIKEKYENILLRGPKSKEDLFLLYQISNDPDLYNRLLGNTGPTWEAARMVTETQLTDQYKPAAFARGMFNPRSIKRVLEAANLGSTAGFHMTRALGANMPPLQRMISHRTVAGNPAAEGGDEGANAVAGYPAAYGSAHAPAWWSVPTADAYRDRRTAMEWDHREDTSGAMGVPLRQGPVGYAADIVRQRQAYAAH